ncbi:hypothetical protein JKP88DRAFT_225453 [Tribonema minus]|uniref:Uncharacterized protein n=1 Tax=Tribonema minus TaxID=303371 RepID=A0A835YP63_9STRA|nr:hypothetical protein JKP88DRAFT_225453 [Tribonema minus]
MVTPPPLTAEHLALQALEQQLEDLSHGTNNMQTARSAAPGSAWSPMSGGGGGGAGEARRTRSRSFLKSRSSGAMGSLAADAAQQYATDSSSAEESARRAPLSPPTEFVMNPIRKMSASAEAQASEQALGRKRSSKSLTGGERRRSGSFGGGGAASVGGGGGGGAVVVSSYTEKRPSAASLMGDRKRSSEAMMAERRKAADAMAELSRSGRALSVASSYAPPPSVGGSSMAESSYVSSASSASTASSLFDQPGGLAGEWLGSDMSVSSVPPSPESVTTHKKKKAPQLDTRHV